MPRASGTGCDADARSGSGRLVISLDFELLWGVRDVHTIESYGPNLRGVWDVVPLMLELFERHGVGATWATVGCLMAQDRDELIRYCPDVRPRYADAGLDPYRDIDALGRDERDDPYHFATSLVRLIAATPGQEIATHTFSHFYALEPTVAKDAFAADLDAALALAASRELVISSIVFPRNQIAPYALRICRDRGITAFRGTEHAHYHATHTGAHAPASSRALRLLDTYVSLGEHHVARPTLVEGLVNVASSRFLRPCHGATAVLEPLRLRRLKAGMSSAALTGGVFHLWWHPHNFGLHPAENLGVLECLLDHYESLHHEHGFQSATMRDVAEEFLGAEAT